MSQPWRVKYDGVCSRCGIGLTAGTPAVYERATHTIRCVECLSSSGDAAPVVAGLDAAALDPGVAGASAQREYERRKGARETRIRDRFGDRLGSVVLAVTSEPQSTKAWATGARGEERLAKALEGIDGLRVLHDRRIPATRGNIDHIAVAPAGIFIIDAKRCTGLIQIRNSGGFFRPDHRLHVGRRDCSALADGLARHVEAVANVLRQGRVDPLPPLRPVLCFVDGEWPLLSPPRSYRGVRLEGTRSIRELVRSPAVLEAAEVTRAADVIASGMPPR